MDLAANFLKHFWWGIVIMISSLQFRYGLSEAGQFIGTGIARAQLKKER